MEPWNDYLKLGLTFEEALEKARTIYNIPMTDEGALMDQYVAAGGTTAATQVNAAPSAPGPTVAAAAALPETDVVKKII